MASPKGRKDEDYAKRRVALREVAAIAKVDVSTVSRSLNNDTRINPARAELIRQLARQLGYRPQPLRSKRAKSVGLLIASQGDRPDEQFLARIMLLLERMLGERGLHVNIAFVPREQTGVEVPAIIQENRVDGVIATGHPPKDLIRRIREMGVAAVAINDSVERLGITCVRSDPSDAVREAVMRLAAWGHRKIALGVQSLQYPTIRARHAAFLSALEFVGLTVEPDHLLCDLPTEVKGGREAVRRWCEAKNLPTAVIFENDWMALGALHELTRRGTRVHQDISLVGHGDLWICESFTPTLSSMYRSEEDLVRLAVERLLTEIEDGDAAPQEQTVPVRMVRRESEGPASSTTKAQA